VVVDEVGGQPESCVIVDSAPEASCCADEPIVDNASLTEDELGTRFTADSKLDQALSSWPVGAFCTACASVMTRFQSSCTAVTSAWYSLFEAVLGSRPVSVLTLGHRLETASVLLARLVPHAQHADQDREPDADGDEGDEPSSPAHR
jgi:hypothetical protein